MYVFDLWVKSESISITISSNCTENRFLQNGALHVSSDQTDQWKLKSTKFIYLRR